MNLPCSIVVSGKSYRKEMEWTFICPAQSPSRNHCLLPLSGHASINSTQGVFWKIMVLASSIDTVAVATSHIPGPLSSHLETAGFQVLEIVITSSLLLRRFTLELRFEDFPDFIFCIQNKP